jgi:hypothetical protein
MSPDCAARVDNAGYNVVTQSSCGYFEPKGAGPTAKKKEKLAGHKGKFGVGAGLGQMWDSFDGNGKMNLEGMAGGAGKVALGAGVLAGKGLLKGGKLLGKGLLKGGALAGKGLVEGGKLVGKGAVMAGEAVLDSEYNRFVKALQEAAVEGDGNKIEKGLKVIFDNLIAAQGSLIDFEKKKEVIDLALERAGTGINALESSGFDRKKVQKHRDKLSKFQKVRENMRDTSIKGMVTETKEMFTNPLGMAGKMFGKK